MRAVKNILLIYLLAIGSQIVGFSQSSYPLQFMFKPSLYSNDTSFVNRAVFIKTRYFHAPGHQPFFCKMEDLCYKSSGIPFKFRLGSVPYADYLEQKLPLALLPR